MYSVLIRCEGNKQIWTWNSHREGIRCLESLAEESQDLVSIFYLRPKGTFNDQITLLNLLSWNNRQGRFCFDQGHCNGAALCGLLLFPVWAAFELGVNFHSYHAFFQGCWPWLKGGGREVVETSWGRRAFPRELTPEACHVPASALVGCPEPVWNAWRLDLSILISSVRSIPWTCVTAHSHPCVRRTMIVERIPQGMGP